MRVLLQGFGMVSRRSLSAGGKAGGRVAADADEELVCPAATLVSCAGAELCFDFLSLDPFPFSSSCLLEALAFGAGILARDNAATVLKELLSSQKVNQRTRCGRRVLSAVVHFSLSSE